MKIGGLGAAALARTHGTPLLVLDLDAVDRAVRALHAACDPHGVEISYAAKAFLCVAFARFLRERGIGLDVCSAGELLTAQRAGWTADRLTLHGAGKTGAEIDAAARGEVAFVVADGIGELARLAQALDASRAPVEILLRLNTGIEAHTHAFVRTGGDDTKFGIHPRDEGEAVRIFAAFPHVRFGGLHAHAGSQIFTEAAFVANAQALVDAAARLTGAGMTTRRLVAGGGFGVPMHEGDGDGIDTAAAVAAIAACVRAGCAAYGIHEPIIGIEPGRAIVAAAGTTLYRVLAVKRQTTRTFVVVDGGMAENPRPAIYGATHAVRAVDPREPASLDVTLCGRSCENDELGPARLPADVREGDLLAMFVTGAYTYSMAGNYNRFPRPAVLGVFSEEERLLVRRETLDDVLSLDTDA